MPRRFNAEDVSRIVWSTETLGDLAMRYGCSREAIRQIKAGITYQDLLPAGYRPPPGPRDPSCLQCHHWQNDRCGMGFPDPAEEGPGFARDCVLFKRP